MAGAEGTGKVVRGEGGGRGQMCGCWRPLYGPGFYAEWEVTLGCVEQRRQEVGLKRVNSNSGDCVESRL